MSKHSLTSALCEIGNAIGAQGRFDIARIRQISLCLSLMELPGFLIEYLSGASKATSLSIEQYMRLNKDKSLVYSEPSAVFGFDYQSQEKYQRTASIGHLNISKLRRLFSKALDSLKQEKASGSASARVLKKKALKSKLSEISTNSNAFTELSHVIIGYCLKLIQVGTDYKEDLAFNTIVEYIFCIFRIALLIEKQKPNDFLALSDGEYEQIYLDIVCSTRESMQLSFVRRICDFHQFIVREYSAEDIDYGLLWAQIGYPAYSQNVDANAVSNGEYLRLLNEIDNNNLLTLLEKSQYKLLVILGYQCGLRLSEAIHLAFKNVQYGDEKIAIIIGNTVFGETKSIAGHRVISEEIRFSDVEKNTIKLVYNRLEELFADDSLVSISDDGTNTRTLLNRHTFSSYIHDRIRRLTGDNTLRYHSFRHNKVTELVTDAFSESKNYNAQCSLEKIYPLRDISTIIGHSRISTTIKSYFHNTELLLKRYYGNYADLLSDYGWSYVLGYSFDYIRDKRRRLKKRGEGASISDLTAHRDLFICVPLPDVLLISPPAYGQIAPWEIPNKTAANDIRLSNINFILTSNKSWKVQPQHLATQLLIDEPTVRQVLQVAQELEVQTGIDVYNVQSFKNNQSLLDDGIREPENFDFFRTESAQVKNYLLNIESQLDANDKIKNALDTWQKTYNSNRNSNFVTTHEELDELIYLFSSLLADVSFEVHGKINQQTREKLAQRRILFQERDIPLANNKISALKKSRLEIITKKSETLKSRRAVIRVLFCVYIKVKLINTQS